MTSATATVGPISEDARACVRCGYSLAGFSEEDGRRPCPECGLLSGLSFLDARDLKNNRPKWLRGLAWGAAVTAAGLATAGTVAAGFNLLASWHLARQIFGGRPRFRSGWMLGRPNSSGIPTWAGDLRGTPGEAVWIAGLLALAPLLLLIGVLLLTRRAGRARADQADAGRRLTLRALGTLPLLFCAATATLVVEALPAVFDGSEQWIILGGITMLSPLPVVLFAHLKRLAARAPAPLLAADSPVVGWALGLGLLLPLISFGVGMGESERYRRGVLQEAFSVAVVAVCAAAIAAYLWSIYLLIRYALAFGNSARQAREVWAASDLARENADATSSEEPRHGVP